MRDLAKVLSNIKIFGYDEDFVAVCDGRNGMLSFPLALFYEALERAIKAEDRVETLQIVAKENYRMYENTLNEVEKWHNEYKAFRDASDVWRKIAVDKNDENARLRKVAEAARGLFLDEGWYLCSEIGDGIDRLEQALAELDKEGER